MHARVAGELRGRIDRGELVPGAALPSEAQLCEQFGASRGTIRAALATLRREGLIDGGQGRPPVVRDVVASQPFENLVSFSAWAEQLGRTAGQRTHSAVGGCSGLLVHRHRQCAVSESSTASSR